MPDLVCLFDPAAAGQPAQAWLSDGPAAEHGPVPLSAVDARGRSFGSVPASLNLPPGRYAVVAVAGGYGSGGDELVWDGSRAVVLPPAIFAEPRHVRLGTDRGDGVAGTLDVPAEADVRGGVAYDGGRLGTLAASEPTVDLTDDSGGTDRMLAAGRTVLAGARLRAFGQADWAAGRRGAADAVEETRTNALGEWRLRDLPRPGVYVVEQQHPRGDAVYTVSVDAAGNQVVTDGDGGEPNGEGGQ